MSKKLRKQSKYVFDNQNFKTPVWYNKPTRLITLIMLYDLWYKSWESKIKIYNGRTGLKYVFDSYIFDGIETCSGSRAEAEIRRLWEMLYNDSSFGNFVDMFRAYNYIIL